MGNPALDQSHRKGAWTEELTQSLMRMWNEGTSASQIAHKLRNGFTRNSVIGKANRLKLPSRAATCQAQRKSVKRAVLPPRPKKESVTLPPPRVTAPISPFFVHEPPPSVGATLALRPQQCRWPIGDHYCDQNKGASRSYCNEHAEVSRERKR